MLKKNAKSSVFPFFRLGILTAVLALVTIGCDRGATEQIQAAQKFADAVVRNNTVLRDSMIATRLFKKHFDNEFVRSSFISWMSSVYDMRTNKFFGTARADVDHDLKGDLQAGGLLSGDEIEETGMVRVKSPDPNELAAYFWMVKQKGHHWAVAMVTKGEMAVNFRQ
jgi:hypothetical protein